VDIAVVPDRTDQLALFGIARHHDWWGTVAALFDKIRPVEADTALLLVWPVAFPTVLRKHRADTLLEEIRPAILRGGRPDPDGAKCQQAR
jgi:hypothetical protein